MMLLLSLLLGAAGLALVWALVRLLTGGIRPDRAADLAFLASRQAARAEVDR